MIYKVVTGYFSWNFIAWFIIFSFTFFVICYIECKYFFVSFSNSTRRHHKSLANCDSVFCLKDKNNLYNRIIEEYLRTWFQSNFIELYILVLLLILFAATLFF